MQIGAQLYTVREYCTNLADFADTLQKIAQIGYKTVQVSGTCAYEPEWLAEQLRKNGLRCVLTHIPPDQIAENPEQVAAAHKIFSCGGVGIGHYDLEACGVDAFAQRFRPAGRILGQEGLRLSYHNHDGEFRQIDGKTVLERLAEAFSPEEMYFTLDTYWVQAGGGDPIAWLDKLSGRTPYVHLKDMAYGRKMAPVGAGNMNFTGILEACLRNGVEYALVEQDDCYGEDPFACLQKSFDYLKDFA